MLYVWVFAGSVIAASLLLLVLLVVRAMRQVKALSRTVAAASARIADATAELEAVKPRERPSREEAQRW